MKLKTLKDIKIEFDETKETFSGLRDKIVMNLKQKAIKWVKEIDRCNKIKIYSCDICPYNDGCDKDGNESIKRWIKYFFNIQESDLK